MISNTMMDYPLTLSAILEHTSKIHPETEIVSRLPDGSFHRCSAATLATRAWQLANALQRAGLRRGDSVCTLMWNHYAHLECYFGIPCAGGVLTTLNLRMCPDDIAYIVNHAGARFLIIDDVLLPLYEKFDHLTQFEQVIVLSFGTSTAPKGFLDYEDFLTGAETGRPDVAILEQDVASVCYTSGTTGSPKGVAYSHRALVLQALCISLPDVFNFSMREVVAPVVPMFHVNGWCIPFAALLTGAKLALPGPRVDAESLLELFSRESVTFSAGVPTLWHEFILALQRTGRRNRLARGLRLVVAGSACPESMLREFDDLDIKAVHAWGMTEMSPVGSFGVLKPHLGPWADDGAYSFRVKQGLPIPFVQARIMTSSGEAAWDGKTIGELQVRGPCVAASYLCDSSASGWTSDGWLRTGDVAHIDSEGYIRVVDRLKDLVKSGGEWISSVDLESTLMNHPAVLEAAVIAVPHPKWQERPLACVRLRTGREASIQELKAYLEGRFSRWWVPDTIVFVDDIPRTSTGKIHKATLRARYSDSIGGVLGEARI